MFFHFRGGMLFACKTHNIILQFESSSMVNISMSVHIIVEVEHSATFGRTYVPGPFYQVNEFYSLPPPPTGVNSLSCSRTT